MAKVILNMSTEEIRKMVFEMILQLPPREILAITEALEKRAETAAMMTVAETGFKEWLEEDDIYDAQT
ncbi:MAG TPA: hypothetical protein PKX93_11460 [bacterium]|nr:hypothetical protein [bacterium]HOL68062.1 hypothetical protein [bacterium]HPP11844.1 hypothetical protein [bacterium]